MAAGNDFTRPRGETLAAVAVRQALEEVQTVNTLA